MSNRKNISHKESPSKKRRIDNSDVRNTVSRLDHPPDHPPDRPPDQYRHFSDKCLLMSITDSRWYAYNITDDEVVALGMNDTKTTEKIKFLKDNGINVRVAMDRTNNVKNKVVDLVSNVVSIHSASGSCVTNIHAYSGYMLKLSSAGSSKIGISVNSDTPNRVLMGYCKIKSSYPR